MNQPILSIIFLSLSTVAWGNDAKNEWHNTTLSDSTIKKIQDGNLHYKQCVSNELQKPEYRKQDSRLATDKIMVQCEPLLAKLREVYLAEKVPGTIADRHLKQIRVQTTRKALQSMMFAEAARQSDQ